MKLSVQVLSLLFTIFLLSSNAQASRLSYCLEKLTGALSSDESFLLEIERKILATEGITDRRAQRLMRIFNDIYIHPNHYQSSLDLIEYLENLATPNFRMIEQQIRGGAFSRAEMQATFGTPLRKFKGIQRSIQRYSAKLDQEFQREIETIENPTSDYLSRVESRRNAKLRFFRDTKFGCRKPLVRQHLNTINSSFAVKQLPLGLLSPAVMYPMIHEEELRELNGRTWGQYGYDLAFIGVQNFIFYKWLIPYIERTGLGVIGGTAASLAFYNGINFAATQTIYNGIFGIGEGDAQRFYESIEYQNYEAEVRSILLENSDEELIHAMAREMNASLGDYPDLQAFVNSDEFAEGIARDSIETDEELRSLLFEAFIDKIYRDQTGEVFESDGNVGLDKFWAESLVDLVTTPVDVWISTLLYSNLCHTMNQGGRGVALTLGAYLAWSVSYNSILFGFRQYGSGM